MHIGSVLIAQLMCDTLTVHLSPKGHQPSLLITPVKNCQAEQCPSTCRSWLKLLFDGWPDLFSPKACEWNPIIILGLF